MFKHVFDAFASSFVAHAAELPVDSTTTNTQLEQQQPQQEEEHFLTKMKNEKQCGVCASPDTLASLKSLVAPTKGNPNQYGLPRKRVLKRTKPFTAIKYLYTSAQVLPNDYHLGNFTDYNTFGVARRWLVNRMVNAPKAEVSHLIRYSPDELQKMKTYWSNPDHEEFEIDYQIPSDPEERELELGTATENNVTILLHDDGSISPLHCPTTYEQLSQGTWTYLHTMAAYYPENPTPEVQKQTSDFFNTFAILYPCEHCKDHMVDYLKRKPVDTTNNRELSMWVCNYHNEVNASLGKRIVHCNPDYLISRYKDGYDESLGVSCDL